MDMGAHEAPFTALHGVLTLVSPHKGHIWSGKLKAHVHVDAAKKNTYLTFAT